MKIEINKDYFESKLKFKLYKWQEKLLDWKGNFHGRAGRKTGKSTGVALKVHKEARENSNHEYIILAPAIRQSSHIYDMVIDSFMELCPEEIVGEPTKTKTKLTNGTVIRCVPSGRTGFTVRCFTANGLVFDEAPYIPDMVYNAVTPMLSTTNGWQIMIGTPHPGGKAGFFYDCEGDNDFLHFHLNSEDCPSISKEFLAKERRRMSKEEYAREYLAEYTEELSRFFNWELIKDRCKFLEWKYAPEFKRFKKYYLGVDVARYGGDENAFVVVEMQEDNRLKAVKVITTWNISTSDTIGRIEELNRFFDFRRIFIDDAGVGAGVTDVLIDKLGRKVVGINNASRSIDKVGVKRVKILKEDLYSNLLVLMEQKKIDMIDLPELKRSLASIQYQYTSNNRLKIFGNYSHITEALVRACWCVKSKGLKCFIA